MITTNTSCDEGDIVHRDIFDSPGTKLDHELKKQTYQVLKRCLDVSVTLLALLMLAPLLALVALCIKIDSRGPVFFLQTRWGRYGTKFRVYKFRTMYVDRGDASGVTQTVEGDPRVTRVGAFLRRSNIDELPQLLNILKGDMSLVGPRCHAIGMLAGGVAYETLVPEYHLRHSVRPGLTGLAQMRGLRGPTHKASRARARIACDLLYIQNQSMLLDLEIIIGTILSELQSRKGF